MYKRATCVSVILWLARSFASCRPSHENKLMRQSHDEYIHLVSEYAKTTHWSLAMSHVYTRSLFPVPGVVSLERPGLDGRGRGGLRPVEPGPVALALGRQGDLARNTRVGKFGVFPLSGGISPLKSKSRLGSSFQMSSFVLAPIWRTFSALQRCTRGAAQSVDDV